MTMDVYIFDINSIGELQGKELLTQERRSRMERYLRKADQARCLGAGLLLRYAFGEERAAQILPDKGLVKGAVRQNAGLGLLLITQ